LKTIKKAFAGAPDFWMIVTLLTLLLAGQIGLIAVYNDASAVVIQNTKVSTIP
jgi:hypothetical protein